MNVETDSIRVGLVLQPRDVLGMDRAAAAEDLTRSAWLRRVIRAHLRALATPKGETTA